MINWILEHILFPAGDAILQTSFVSALKQWRKISTHDSEKLASLQRKNLKELLLYMYAHNRYYRQFLPDHHYINHHDPVEILKSLPLLTKETIRNNYELMISEPFLKSRQQLILEKSSGSSGIQGSVYMSRKEAYNVSAAQTHLWEWSGYRLGSELLQLGMTTDRGLIKGLKDFFSKTTYRHAFRIDANDTKELLESLREKKDAFFGGYASGLYAYACIAEQYGLKTEFKSVISWGDKMFGHYRKKIETVFNTRVFDTYGCTEGIIIGGQCKQGNYHILTPHVYLELLDDNNNPVKPGSIGNVVVTRLDGRSFPLVRYKLGDLAIKAEDNKQCTCGMHYPQLSMIIGRETDIVYTPKGNPLIVHFFTGIFEHEQDIKQFRVTQYENKNILIEYITDLDDHAAILERLTEIMNNRSGEVLPVNFSRVNHIPATISGKPQIVLSHLKKQLNTNPASSN
jgi:phenylacetate-CoA ligase